MQKCSNSSLLGHAQEIEKEYPNFIKSVTNYNPYSYTALCIMW